MTEYLTVLMRDRRKHQENFSGLLSTLTKSYRSDMDRNTLNYMISLVVASRIHL